MPRAADETSANGSLLAGIQFSRDEDIDTILAAVAESMRQRGIAICGLLARDEPDPRSPHPVMFVENIADGQRIQISQRLGPEARGCRLDPDGLARAAVVVEASLGHDTALLILNRFGRAEAEGGGLRGVIDQALGLGIPVLIAVRETYADAWSAFHGGLAEPLPRNRDSITRWCLDAVEVAPSAAHA